ncbi:MAG: tryptophan--tRNA ligase, partial [Comamonadaceae bacterium CG_4_9_14_0_8_um_filter_60_18]
LQQAYLDGIAWGDAKQIVFERVDREIAPMRAAYEALLADPARIESILAAGAAKARAIATPFMVQLRHAVGLRDLRAQAAASVKTAKVALPLFKQYREKDGQFYFKLNSADGTLLLQSAAFASPKDAAHSIAALQQQGAAALATLAAQVVLAEGVSSAQVDGALQTLREAKAQAKSEKNNT